MVSGRSAQIAEAKALLKGLEMAQKLGTPSETILLITDSSYCTQAFNIHSLAWTENGYSDHRGKPIACANIWKEIAH